MKKTEVFDISKDPEIKRIVTQTCFAIGFTSFIVALAKGLKIAAGIEAQGYNAR